jgi:SOS response regulatory protein OraA/RecX
MFLTVTLATPLLITSYSAQFPFHVEDVLEGFVWKWIHLTEKKVVEWVEQALRQDHFEVHNGDTAVASEDARHSVSVIDIFRSFNQVVEQMMELNWADEFQYAKFMTALSKSTGRGVARYCEAVEQMFAKEMDRLSPDQEAALNQTTQEKLMQFAKDAWASKEKIEPFQFFPRVRNWRTGLCFHN